MSFPERPGVNPIFNHFYSTNPVIIGGWITLVKSFEIIITEFTPTGGGGGYTLTFYSSGEEICIGHIQGGYTRGLIFVSGKNGANVTLRIENYAELWETVKELESAVGFQRP